MIGRFLGVLIIVVSSVSCVSSAEKKAQAWFQEVDKYVANHDLTTAIRLLDSVMAWNKDDYGIVGEALKKQKPIAVTYHTEVIRTSEALLEGLEPRFDSLVRDFRFTEGAGEQPGIYEYKRQTVQNSWNRTYLKMGLDEKGNTWLTSQYFGKEWIDHTSLRIYDRDLVVLTDTIPLGDPWNRKVEDQGDKWETIDFRDGTDNGAIAFIAGNWEKSLKVRFNGKKFYYIVMESFDKEAFHEGLELAQVLKERTRLRDAVEQHRADLRKLGVAVPEG
jgi:hypothetical protein